MNSENEKNDVRRSNSKGHSNSIRPCPSSHAYKFQKFSCHPAAIAPHWSSKLTWHQWGGGSTGGREKWWPKYRLKLLAIFLIKRSPMVEILNWSKSPRFQNFSRIFDIPPTKKWSHTSARSQKPFFAVFSKNTGYFENMVKWKNI